MFSIDFFTLVGFMLAGYAIIANDSIQTLGTFLASNSKRPWWLLWGFSSLILALVVGSGWFFYNGDPAFGRLEKFPWPEQGMQWYHVVPPFIILILTRFGIPVSTTFLILVIFNPNNISAMLFKSALGYAVAFCVAIFLYRYVIEKTTEYFNRTSHIPVPNYWIVLQWLATAFLWSQWLIQDLANIFVYLPRTLSGIDIALALIFLVALQGLIFFQMGGAIQQIVKNKTGTADIRAATIIDFIYAVILLVFKEWSNMPMSTTWVFLGLLAGRQLAISIHIYHPPMRDTARIVLSDAAKAGIGLAISIVLAISLPHVAS